MVELMIALVLLALMSAVLFGSLNLARAAAPTPATAKADASSGMRLAGDYLRTQLRRATSAAHAQGPELLACSSAARPTNCAIPRRCRAAWDWAASGTTASSSKPMAGRDKAVADTRTA